MQSIARDLATTRAEYAILIALFAALAMDAGTTPNDFEDAGRKTLEEYRELPEVA